MNITISQTKKLIKAHKNYTGGGIFSWREAMAIINQNLVVKNDICVHVLTVKETQGKLNSLLNDAQKEAIVELLS